MQFNRNQTTNQTRSRGLNYRSSLLFLLILSANAVAQGSSIKVPEPSEYNDTIGESQSADGVKVDMLLKPGMNAETLLRQYFPKATSVQVSTFLPETSGGSSFMGLVGRLFGERVNPEFEGIKTKRFLYHAYSNKDLVGSVHGARTTYQGKPFEVFVVYAASSAVQKVLLTNVPASVVDEFNKGDYLKQFEGRPTEDFEVVRGRKGKVTSRGNFFKSVKKPAGALARAYFDQITRSVRYNAAFMDVAFFITRHPNLDSSEQVLAEVSGDAPEAVVEKMKRSTASGGRGEDETKFKGKNL